MNPRSESKVTRLRQQVGERDGWLCWRWRIGQSDCGGTIDPTLRYPHRMSASLEHTVDLCLGGDPYDPATATVSHLHCNRTSGASLGARRKNAQRRGQPAIGWTNPAGESHERSSGR